MRSNDERIEMNNKWNGMIAIVYLEREQKSVWIVFESVCEKIANGVRVMCVCVCCWWPITSYSETSIAAVWWCWPTSSFVIVVVVVIIVVVVVVLNNCSLSWFKDLFRKSNTHTLCFRLLRIDEEEDGGNKNSFLICKSLFMMIFKTDFHIPNA